MRIQHNIAALNAYRNLTNNNSAVSKNLEKLSSGYRINRAGDDAAGLAISEKMRAQITGLKTAQKNANDGISLVQTAEGALTEVHSMLNRMVELANQSANGTYANAPDRDNLQAEIDSLMDEIDRISEATNFNGINLLDGSLGLDTKTFTNITTTPEQQATTMDGKALGVTGLQHTGASVTAVKPYFEIDLKDVSFKVTGSGTAGTVTWGLATSGAGTITFATGVTAGTGFATATIDHAVAANTATTDVAATAIAGDLDGKVAKIGDDVFSMAAAGTKITFTYIGKMDNNVYKADTNGDTVTTATFNPNQTITFAAGKDANVASISSSGRVDCNMINVTDPVAGQAPVRTGFRLKIDEAIINGGELKIGNTTFKFDKDSTTTVASGTTDSAITIGIKGKSGSDLVKYVTEQMSHATLTMNAEDSASTATFTFNIGRVQGDNANATIEFEEAVPAAATGPYANFSTGYVQSQISQSRGHANATSSVTIETAPTMGQSIKFGDTTYVFGGKDSADGKVKGVKLADTAADAAANLAAAIGGSASANGNTVTVTAPDSDANKVGTFGSAGLMLQIGDTSDDYNRMTVDVRDMSAKALGIADIDISTQGGAQMAVDKIKDAINSVSSQRGDLGAIQNRLEHTINNLSVTAENMTAAESRIRDVDMAEEMMAYTKNNILVQAAQAMLAQANQVPQGVLQLLQ